MVGGVRMGDRLVSFLDAFPGNVLSYHSSYLMSTVISFSRMSWAG